MNYYLFSISLADMSQRKYYVELISAENLREAVYKLENKNRYQSGICIETMFVEPFEGHAPVAVKFMRELIKETRMNRLSHLQNSIALNTAGQMIGKKIAENLSKTKRKPGDQVKKVKKVKPKTKTTGKTRQKTRPPSK